MKHKLYYAIAIVAMSLAACQKEHAAPKPVKVSVAEEKPKDPPTPPIKNDVGTIQ